MYKLVHVRGEAFTQTELADEQFGLVYNDVLKIKRTVEVYQWKENKVEDGEETRYEHTKDWSEFPIDMNTFQDRGACDGP